MTFLPLQAWWVVLGAGLGLLCWVLRPQTGSGERRCPECWYDLSKVPGWVCPECGFRASRGAELYPVRRNWALACLGILAFTPAVWAFYEALWMDPLGDAVIGTLKWPMRLGGLALAGWGGWIAARAAWGAAFAYSIRKAPPHAWASLVVLGALVMLHGYGLFLLPRARILHWQIFPPWLQQGSQDLIHWVGGW